jgi:predicted ester cyclase
MPPDHDANKKLIQEYIDLVWSKADMAAADRILDDHLVVRGAHYKDKEGEKAFVKEHHQALEMKYRIQHIVADGDMVAVQIVGQGVHVKNHRGIAPTHKPLKLNGGAHYRIKNGKIVEAIHNVDLVDLRLQMGETHIVPQRDAKLY